MLCILLQHITLQFLSFKFGFKFDFNSIEFGILGIIEWFIKTTKNKYKVETLFGTFMLQHI